MKQSSCSLGGLLLHAGLGVGESNVELLSALDEFLSGLGGDVVGDFAAVGPVVHEEQFNVFLVLDQKLSETTGEHVSGLGGLLKTDVGHHLVTTELAAHGVVNTSWLPPGFLNTHKLVAVRTLRFPWPQQLFSGAKRRKRTTVGQGKRAQLNWGGGNLRRHGATGDTGIC